MTDPRKIAENWLFENDYDDNQYVIQGNDSPFGPKAKEISLTEVLAQFVKTFNTKEK